MTSSKKKCGVGGANPDSRQFDYARDVGRLRAPRTAYQLNFGTERIWFKAEKSSLEAQQDQRGIALRQTFSSAAAWNLLPRIDSFTLTLSWAKHKAMVELQF